MTDRSPSPAMEQTATRSVRDRVERVVLRASSIGWWALIAILPIGHITGLRNGLTIVVVVATLAVFGRRSWKDLPARWAWCALITWCALSIAWSSVPDISWGKLRTDLLLPFLAYWGAYAVGRYAQGLRAIIGGGVTGLFGLTLLSLFVVLPRGVSDYVRHVVPLEDFAGVAAPLPHWYPGVGDASMAAALAAAILLAAPHFLPRVPRARWGLAWLALAVVVVVTNNRNAVLAIPVVALFYFWRMRRIKPESGNRRAFNRRRIAAVTLAACVALIALVALLELGARERLRVIGQSSGDASSAALTLVEHDTRPMIWAYYGKLVLRAPLAGVGFGRTVPGIHYHTQDDRELAKREFNAYIHAHNLFLNWWLQTGVVGMLLLIALLVEIVRVVHRAARRSPVTMVRRAIALAIYAAIALMLIRNLTDDLLVYGMATMFWAIVGGLAGALLAQDDSATA